MPVDPVYEGTCDPLLTSCQEDCVTIDWCGDIEQRCDAVEGAIQSYMADPATDINKVLDLRGAHFSCLVTSFACKVKAPILTPAFSVEPEKLHEAGQYHDVPAFFEISGHIINDYLRKPNGPEDTAKILYFASGNHIAPLELGFQILEQTDFQNVGFTYTEIYAGYYKDILTELCKLEQQGLISNLQHSRGASTDHHDEYVIAFQYRTHSGKTKNIRLTYVLGKKDDEGNYPAYFRKSDYENADIVIGFDAESVDDTTAALTAAHVASFGSDAGKIMVLENRGEYVQWAKFFGKDIMGYFSQHFGCETKKQDMGLNLRPILFRL